jgi:putative transposase
MHKDTPKLTDQDTLAYSQAVLQEHLPLEAEGYTCTTDDLWQVLLGVAANRGTIERVCRDLVGAPDPETVRRYFREQLTVEGLPTLEQALNAALAAEVPRRVLRCARAVAIDYHDRPYYGKQPQAEGLWIRARARHGTTRFYRVATAYVVLNGLRVTLAVHFVQLGDDDVGVLALLLQRAKRLGIRVACLLLDKEFDAVTVFEALERWQQPALIACTQRGTTGGTRGLCQGRKSYCTAYTYNAGRANAYTAHVAVCRTYTTANRTKRLKRRVEWLVYVLVLLDLTPRQARRLYRRRFGIETSYRCAGQVRGWTTSPNAAYRFLLIALSFVLLNVWVHLRWLYTQVPRRGRRYLDTARFRLARFVSFILRALERLYGGVREIQAPAAPRT